MISTTQPRGSVKPLGDTWTHSMPLPKISLAAQGVLALENAAEKALPGLTEEPAWPSLRGRLLLPAASGSDPIAQLRTFADVRELASADDQAAVLGWRLDDTGNQNGFEPLPWLPAIPHMAFLIPSPLRR